MSDKELLGIANRFIDAVGEIGDLFPEIERLQSENNRLKSSYEQVNKACSYNGFEDIDELVASYNQIKSEKDKAVDIVNVFGSILCIGHYKTQCHSCKHKNNGCSNGNFEY